MILRGCDVSSYQGEPGQWKAAAGDFDWCGVKFTELHGTSAYLNPDAHADWSWLGQNGKLRVAYAFGHPSSSSAATARLLANSVTDAGLTDDDAIALDLEVTDGLAPAAVNLWAASVLRELERLLSRHAICYTFIDFARAGNCASLGAYHLWLADPSSPAGQPRVPAPWKDWTLHQYATSPIDRDVARFASLEDMRRALGKPQPVHGHEHIVHWHLVGVRRSMNWESHRHHTSVDDMFALAEAAGHHYKAPMADYIRRADWDAPIPEFTELFAYGR